MTDREIGEIIEGMHLADRLRRSTENVVYAKVMVVNDEKFGRVIFLDRIVGTHSQPLPTDECKSAAFLVPERLDRVKLVDAVDAAFRDALGRLIPITFGREVPVERLLGKV